MIKKLREWLGWDARGELVKAKIALQVAREIADDWKAMAQKSEKQLLEVMIENDRLRNDHGKLSEHHEKHERNAQVLVLALQRLHGSKPSLNGKK